MFRENGSFGGSWLFAFFLCPLIHFRSSEVKKQKIFPIAADNVSEQFVSEIMIPTHHVKQLGKEQLATNLSGLALAVASTPGIAVFGIFLTRKYDHFFSLGVNQELHKLHGRHFFQTGGIELYSAILKRNRWFVYALRRRFSFFDIEPGFASEGFMKYQQSLDNETFSLLVSKVQELNKEISMDKSLGKGFCIGHSYFCGQSECTEEWLQAIVDYDILPMLSEYWFDDLNKLQRWENILRGVFQ